MWSTPSHVHDLGDEEHFTAEHALRYFLDARGVTHDQIGVRDVVVGTFLGYTWRSLVAKASGRPAESWLHSHDTIPLYHGTASGRPVSLVRFPMGAPAAAMVMEQLIACGGRHFLLLGAAGSLQERAPVATLVLPDGAVREEGTSFHYLAPEATPLPSPLLTDLIRSACQESGIEPQGGINWTTDAIFREFKKKVEHYRAAGVVSVEMEASAMYAVGGFRDVDVALLLVISDELFRPWTPAFQHESYRERLRRAQDILLTAASRITLPAS